MKVTLTPLDAEKEAAILTWNNAKARLDAAKASESAARQTVYGLFADTAAEGVQNFRFANGYTLKITNTLNVKLLDDGVALNAALDKIEREIPNGHEVAGALVQWKPALSRTAYRDVSSAARALIDPLLDFSPGSPKVELVAPKIVKGAV